MKEVASQGGGEKQQNEGGEEVRDLGLEGGLTLLEDGDIVVEPNQARAPRQNQHRRVLITHFQYCMCI